MEFLQRLQDGTHPAPPFSETAEIWPLRIEQGRVVFEAQPSERFLNPMGVVHGGWTAMLLDTAMGCAVHSALAAGQGYTTTDLHTTFVKAVRSSSGRLRCEANLLHLGRRTATAEGRIFDGDGSLLAHGCESCLLIPAAPAVDRST
jgi:uncharacterized protein (TIGR00369 family)